MLDIFLLGILALSAIIGVARGFVREVLSIGAWVGAIFITLYGFVPLRPWVRAYVSPEALADFIAGAAIFFVSLGLLSAIARMVGKRTRESLLGPLDRTLGLAFGVLRGAFIISAAFLAIVLVMGDKAAKPEWAAGSRLYPWVRVGADLLTDILPFDLERIRPPVGLRKAAQDAVSDKQMKGYEKAVRSSLEKLIEKKDDN